MSYWVYLTAPNGDVLQLDEPHDIKGGTYVLGGTNACELNITYNYSGILYRVLDGGIPALDGRTARDTAPMIQAAVEKLSDDTDPNYWNATEGNVREALQGLLVFARAHPDGVWSISL